MNSIFPTIRIILLYFLLVTIGLYAGMIFFHEMCPVETKMSVADYVKYWKIADGDFMHPRMSIFGPGLMALFVLTILFHIRKWKSLFFLFLGLSFIFFVLEVITINTQQMPINEIIRNFDPGNATNTDFLEIEKLQAKSISNFHIRLIFSLLSFMSLMITPFFHHKID